MTTPSDFDRSLSDWLDEAGAARVPEYFDLLIDRTRRTRQRPAWASLERWLPMQLSIPRPLAAVPRAVGLLILLALLIALAVVALLQVGGPRRLPPPFGLAATGLLTFDAGGDIYVANVDGSARHALTTGPADDISPTFSLDGTRIAFWSGTSCSTSSSQEQAACAGPFSLIVMAPDGTKPVVVADAVPELQDPTVSWAPDGAHLAYLRKEANRSQVIVTDLVHGTPVAIGDATIPASDPQWSPRGDVIAYIGAVDSSHHAVFVAAAGGGAARNIASPAGGVDLGGLTWSPDGHALTFYASDGGPHDIWVVGPDGSGAQNLTRSAADEFFPAWSNAGTRIAYEQIDPGATQVPQVNDVWIMNGDGSGKTRLATHDITGAPPLWSPDDRSLLAYDAHLTLVYVIPVDGSGPELAIPAAGNYGNGSWQRLAR